MSFSHMMKQDEKTREICTPDGVFNDINDSMCCFGKKRECFQETKTKKRREECVLKYIKINPPQWQNPKMDLMSILCFLIIAQLGNI